MRVVGYAESDMVDDIVRGLSEGDLEKAAALAKIDTPLTIREIRTLLLKMQPDGELALIVKRVQGTTCGQYAMVCWCGWSASGGCCMVRVQLCRAHTEAGAAFAMLLGTLKLCVTL